MYKGLISVLFFLVCTQLNVALQPSQPFKEPFLSTPRLYDDFIYGFNQEKQFSLYSLIGDYIYSFKETNFNLESQKIYFNKVFLLDDNQQLSVFDLKSQQKYYSIKGYDIRDFVISSSHLIILTDKGDIVCFDYLTGTFKWQLPDLAIDGIYFFGQSGFLLSYKDKTMYVISTQLASVEKKVVFKHVIDSVLSATNSFAVVQAKKPYILTLVDYSLNEFDVFDVSQIKHWYRKKAAVGYDDSLNSFFLYDLSLEEYSWFVQADSDVSDFLFSDTYLCFIDVAGVVNIISLYDGELVKQGHYDVDEKAESFTFINENWYIITKSKLVLIEDNNDLSITLDIQNE